MVQIRNFIKMIIFHSFVKLLYTNREWIVNEIFFRKRLRLLRVVMMATIREMLQKWISTFFWTVKHDKMKRSVIIRENLQKLISTLFFKRFVIVTIREILQKLISTFFLTSSKTKESEVSWWQLRDGYHLRKFAKINFDFFLRVKHDERKRSVMMATSRWLPFANICKN